MNNHFTAIGNRLSQYITSKGISQSKFARLTGTSASQVFNMLNGTKYGVDKLLMVFKALPDINPEWLLFGTGTIEKDKPDNNFTLEQLEKFASGQTEEALKAEAIEKDQKISTRLAELQELLDICQAEKTGLERIIELKDEMIELLKQQR